MSEITALQLSLSFRSALPPPPVVYCEAHLERVGTRVPVASHELKLCRRCLDGHPILPAETIGYQGGDQDAARRRRYYARHRHQILSRIRQQLHGADSYDPSGLAAQNNAADPNRASAHGR